MADVTVSSQQITGNGLNLTTNNSLSVSDTYKVRNDGRVFIYVVNGDTSGHTVTVETPVTRAGYAISDLSVTVPAGENRYIGPFPVDVFNDDNNDLNITFDDITSMELAALRL